MDMETQDIREITTIMEDINIKEITTVLEIEKKRIFRNYMDNEKIKMGGHNHDILFHEEQWNNFNVQNDIWENMGT